MSLDRFINREHILKLSGGRYGQLFQNRDLSVLNDIVLIPNDPNIINNQISELHIYSFYGDYIAGDHNASYTIHDKYSNSLLIDIGRTFKTAVIQKGSYVIVNNLFSKFWGDFNNRPVLVNEISPDRTEVKLVIDKPFVDGLNEFKQKVSLLQQKDILNNLVINFGNNRIQKIINIRYDDIDNNVVYLKLYQPLFDEIQTLDKSWFVFEVIDPYVDSIILSNPVQTGDTFVVPGPNWYLDTEPYINNSTSYKNWNDVLDSDLQTSQGIIDRTLSGSNQVRLNIDYTDFTNFVFYSSAEERLRNFHYKVSKIEEYSSSIEILTDTTASNTTFISGAININQRRIDQITTNFDSFERWLYYAPTASIFTHDISGSVTPYPKRIVNSKVVPYTISSSIVQTWYDTILTDAITYDQNNTNRFYWAIPEHIIMDSGNDDFVLFADMIGQHYDNVYSYIKALTQIHERDEHPERGFSNDLSYYIAKSFGWQLQNARSASDLWKYKLGRNQQNELIQTGSLQSLTHEDQTQRIWRRIINNLPLLLKTKGTSRSVKALMSIYGIPQTLISIKEYGGPSVELDKPTLIEDRYYYKLNFTGRNWIELPRQSINPNSGSWDGTNRVPDTVEFRFNTNYSSSLSMSLWAIENYANRSNVYSNLSLHHVKSITGNYLYSGSYAYGYLKLTVAERSGANIVSSSVQTPYLPLYDNQDWNVALITEDVTSNSTYYDDDTSALIILGSGSDYYTSTTNVFGYPQGIVKSTPTPSPVYNNDIDAYAATSTTGYRYYLSGSNTYGLSPFTVKYITEYGGVTMYNDDSSALADGLSIGDEYVLSGSNVYGVHEGIAKIIGASNGIRLRVASTRDCSHGNIVFTSSILWSGINSINQTWGNDITGSGYHTIMLGGTTGSFNNRFSGSIHGYKEYYESISEATFNNHVLNPQSYAGNNPTSSYYTLYRYFPLGLDVQRWNHVTYTQVSSSHPNRVASFNTTASFKGFTGSQEDQYTAAREQFYVYLPSLGGNVIRSQKIRFENDRLIRDLSPNNISTIGENDTSTFDTNRLAIVFSPTDQVNNDIFNHSGFSELDDYIADPQYEYEDNYDELNRFNYHYYRKYQQRVDVNSFIRIFSLYDYSFFEQVKQLLPGRADYIGGVLVENDVLHRNKINLTKRPKLTNPQYYTELDLNVQSSSANNLTYEVSRSIDLSTEITHKYLTSSIQNVVDIGYIYTYKSASIQPNLLITGVVTNYPDTGSLRDGLQGLFDAVPNRYSGSQSPTQSYVDTYKLNCCYKKVNFYYSASGQFNTKYERQWYSAVSKSYGWYYSRSLECTDYQYSEECTSIENKRRFSGTQLSGLGININSPDTIDKGPVVSVFISRQPNIYYDDDPNGGNLKVE